MKIKILKNEVKGLRNELADSRGYLKTLREAISVEEIGEFKEWLETKRRTSFEVEDGKQKAEVLKRDKDFSKK